MSAEITGTVRLSYHAERRPGEPPCICCPGFPSHVFGSGLDLDPYESRHPEHFGRRIDYWLDSVLDFKQLEGRRIRITAELLPEDAPAGES